MRTVELQRIWSTLTVALTKLRMPYPMRRKCQWLDQFEVRRFGDSKPKSSTCRCYTKLLQHWLGEYEKARSDSMHLEWLECFICDFWRFLWLFPTNQKVPCVLPAFSLSSKPPLCKVDDFLDSWNRLEEFFTSLFLFPIFDWGWSHWRTVSLQSSSYVHKIWWQS